MRTVLAKRLLRGLFVGGIVFAIGVTLNDKTDQDRRKREINTELTSQNVEVVQFVSTQVNYSKQESSSELAKAERQEKILIEEKDGKKIFSIRGLPKAKIKEVRKKFIVTTISEEDKAKMTEEAKKTYERRKNNLLETCGSGNKHKWRNTMQLIAAPEKDLTVCVVQKAGSSSWHRLVYELREPNGTWSGMGHQLNKDHGAKLPGKEKDRLMNSERGTRVLAVRHPFARLLSGWNNKMHKNHLLSSTKILTTLKGIESYIGRHAPDEDHIIAFEDFVQYITDTGLHDMDVHFKSIEDLCKPCQYPYDFISKAETSLKDLWYVLDRFGGVMPSFTKHTATGSGEKQVDKAADPWETEKKIMRAFFRKIPVQTVKKLKRMYQQDFDRFGYTFDVETMTAGDVLN